MTEVKLNGEPYSLQGSSIMDLLLEIELEVEKVAIELNRTIISKEEFATTNLKSGDEIELVEFVGGG